MKSFHFVNYCTALSTFEMCSVEREHYVFFSEAIWMKYVSCRKMRRRTTLRQLALGALTKSKENYINSSGCCP
jgi:hypothetical protein